MIGTIYFQFNIFIVIPKNNAIEENENNEYKIFYIIFIYFLFPKTLNLYTLLLFYI